MSDENEWKFQLFEQQNSKKEKKQEQETTNLVFFWLFFHFFFIQTKDKNQLWETSKIKYIKKFNKYNQNTHHSTTNTDKLFASRGEQPHSRKKWRMLYLVKMEHIIYFCLHANIHFFGST